MRYFLALIIAVPLLAMSLEANAGLVEDLRSGKSDVRALSSQGGYSGVIKFWREMKSQADFKAIVNNQGWSHGAMGRHSAEAAIEAAIKNCEKEGGGRTKCNVYAVGDNIVQGYSQKKLADAIEAYQLKVSGSKTTTKPTTTPKTIYCKQGNGSVYVGGWCGKNTEITKAEYFRLKYKKKDTASTTEPDAAPSVDDPLEAKLEKLKKLFEKGLITEEEAAAVRAKLLEDLFVFNNLLEEKRSGPSVVETFRDCPECPEMVVVPSGSFMMNSPERDYTDEGPIHRVSVRQPFAIGKYEVTFAEWDACVSSGGCDGYRPDDRGWGRGNRPVISVGWEDATSYTSWLSRKTGHSYRLPSEAEWEYAARAGTTTRYHFGNSISSSQANYGGNKDKTVPVGSYPANAFGLHDVHGNVWEWTEDCWNGGYAGAPSDTNVRKVGDCSRRVLRGGSWVNYPWNMRSTFRGWLVVGIDFSSYGNGFRIVRALP